MGPASGKYRSGRIDWSEPRRASSTSATRAWSSSTTARIVASYHEWGEGEQPLQYVRCTRFRLAD